MARTVRDANLETRTARSRLKAASKPYYRAIDPGLHIGYRKGVAGGKWVMRWYVGEGDYKLETLTTADDSADADGVAVLDFRQAQAMIRERHVEYRRVARGLPAKDGPYTVSACLDEYIAFLEGNRKSARDARYRCNALIVPTLGDIACVDLTATRLRRWLEDAATTAPRLRSRKGAETRYREIDDDDDEQRRRRRASANRVLTILKAALNRAWRDGKIASDDAWRRVEPFEEADAARVRYLAIDECRRLINAAEGEFRDLIRGALLTGCRFGELAALQVHDFNRDAGTLHIRTSKSGKGRHVVLNDEGAEFFGQITAGRAGIELLLRKTDGNRWGKSNQTRPMAEACGRAKIVPAANFHALRHTYASHSVMAGAPLLVVAKNLGHSDTRMVEKHYGHLSDSYIADAIRAAAPRFGAESSKVVPL
ncbi:MAG TPA: site-specific integrase [Stellaceae bacterium]|jgi:integrase|nr:site-specific integrase [Stellaceae bacterium]